MMNRIYVLHEYLPIFIIAYRYYISYAGIAEKTAKQTRITMLKFLPRFAGWELQIKEQADDTMQIQSS